jgi:hypothetical protein
MERALCCEQTMHGRPLWSKHFSIVAARSCSWRNRLLIVSRILRKCAYGPQCSRTGRRWTLKKPLEKIAPTHLPIPQVSIRIPQLTGSFRFWPIGDAGLKGSCPGLRAPVCPYVALRGPLHSQATQGHAGLQDWGQDIDPMVESWELTVRGRRSHGLTYPQVAPAFTGTVTPSTFQK